MTAGPIFPFSSMPDTGGRIFPGPHAGATNARVDFGMQVELSLGAAATWRQRFAIPEVLPSGTLKLVLVALANATAGDARVNPTWAAVSRAGGNPDTVTLTAEGVTTITWAAGDNDDYKETKITLDASTLPTAGQVLVMSMVFDSNGSNWTLAQVSTWQSYLVYE